MKRTLTLLLALLLVFSCAACGNTGTTQTDTGDSAAPADTGNAGAPADEGGSPATGDIASSEDAMLKLIHDTDAVIDTSRKTTVDSDERYDTWASAITMAINDLTPFRGGPGKVLITCEIYEALFDQYDYDKFEGRLAQELNEVDDLHYQVTLYDYITDCEGNNVTASDVVFTYEQYIDSGFLNDAEYIESVKAIGDYEVEFTFTKPLDGISTFPNLFCNVYIFTEKAYGEHNFATDPIGTGPYYVNDFVAGSHVNVTVNEDYWQVEELRSEMAAQKVQNIRVNTLGDDSLCELAVTTGDNGLQRVDASSVNKYLEGGEYYGYANLYLHPMPIYHAILPNCSEGNFFSDINARLALFYAVDLDTMVMAAGQGITFEPCVVYCHNSASDFDDSWKALADDTFQTVYNPDLAKEYLAKTNYNGEKLRILLGADSSKKTLATVLMGQLQAIGVNCELMSLEDTLVDGYLDDPSSWDIYMGGESSRPYAINGLIAELGKDRNGGLTKNYVDDDELQDLLTYDYTAEGFSPDTTAQILQIILDNAYCMATVSSVDIYAYDNHIAKPYISYGGSWIGGSFDYYLD